MVTENGRHIVKYLVRHPFVHRKKHSALNKFCAIWCDIMSAGHGAELSSRGRSIKSGCLKFLHQDRPVF
jgi:hypothetical protein